MQMEIDGLRCGWEWMEEDVNGNKWNELGCIFSVLPHSFSI